jgi:Protein of unknown function (DUF2490)
VSRLAIQWVAVLVLGLLAGRQAHGQDSATVDTSDLEGWTSVELEYEHNEQWMFSAEEQLRLKSDVSEVDRHFSQLGVRFDAPRGLSLDGGIRFIRRNDTRGNIQGYESERRYHVSASYKHKPGRFSLSTRVRYQTKGDMESDGFTETDRHLRLRARARYNVRNWKLDPDVAAELYRPLGSDAGSEFDKLRLTLGSDLDVWSLGELSMFYRMERELGVDVPWTTHIIGLKFTYVLKRD